MSATEAGSADPAAERAPDAGRDAEEGAPPRVLAVNRFYWPDHAATSQILVDLATFLAARGWQVNVLTSRMRYDDSGARLAAREEKDGVRIRRVWTSRMGRDRLAGRALDYLTFYLSAAAALVAEARRGDVVLVTTDPPLFLVVAAWIARLKGARLVTWNHDLFPEIAATLGVAWVNGRLGRLLGRLRDRALGRATVNVALSEAMAERLRWRGVAPGSLRVLPNWCDAKIRSVPHRDNPLRRDWGLEHSFVIGYSGNLGRAHMPERVAELVSRTHNLSGLVWLFIGGGAGLARIREVVAETGARNVQIRPYQRREDLALSLSVPDLHLVSLDPRCEGFIMPSKIYGILASGRPILFLGDPCCAQGREVEAQELGVCLDLLDPGSWRDAIGALMGELGQLCEMGRRARMLSESYAASHALARWEAVLAEAARE